MASFFVEEAERDGFQAGVAAAERGENPKACEVPERYAWDYTAASRWQENFKGAYNWHMRRKETREAIAAKKEAARVEPVHLSANPDTSAADELLDLIAKGNDVDLRRVVATLVRKLYP